MLNKEAENQIKRIVVELEILDDADFNAEHKENIREALRLLEGVMVWSYED